MKEPNPHSQCVQYCPLLRVGQGVEIRRDPSTPSFEPFQLVSCQLPVCRVSLDFDTLDLELPPLGSQRIELNSDQSRRVLIVDQRQAPDQVTLLALDGLEPVIDRGEISIGRIFIACSGKFRSDKVGLREDRADPLPNVGVQAPCTDRNGRASMAVTGAIVMTIELS